MKIIVAIDTQPSSEKLTAFIRDTAPPSGAEIRVITVIPSIMAYQSLAIVPALMLEMRDQARHEALLLVHNAVQNLQQSVPETKTEAIVLEGNPAHEILSMANDWEADLICIGSHGRKGIGRLLRGSVADEIASKAGCLVFVVNGCYSGKTKVA